jgi:hypothetical protein
MGLAGSAVGGSAVGGSAVGASVVGATVVAAGEQAAINMLRVSSRTMTFMKYDFFIFFSLF